MSECGSISIGKDITMGKRFMFYNITNQFHSPNRFLNIMPDLIENNAFLANIAFCKHISQLEHSCSIKQQNDVFCSNFFNIQLDEVNYGIEDTLCDLLSSFESFFSSWMVKQSDYMCGKTLILVCWLMCCYSSTESLYQSHCIGLLACMQLFCHIYSCHVLP